MPTAQHELIEMKLPAGVTLKAFVARKRQAGLGWRAITDEIATETGVYVSHTSVSRWFNKMPSGRPSPTAAGSARDLVAATPQEEVA